MNLVVRLMRIIEVKEDKKQYLDLLLLADEQENMIDRYLDKGKCMCLMIMGLNASASLPMKEMMCLKSRTLQLFQTIKAKVMQNP